MKLSNLERATFAGGCFWCMVKPFDELPGIDQVVSGYTGGHVENPIYEDVISGKTGHYEAVQITYDPTVFPYEKILELYWPQIDPTDPGGQFYDRGQKYETAIFFHNDQQKELAEQSKKKLEESGRFKKPIVTKILPAKPFYEAEEHHQKFYKKQPLRYQSYSQASGRESFKKKYWNS
jgi:methionine-S-sulfoxide reductase